MKREKTKPRNEAARKLVDDLEADMGETIITVFGSSRPGVGDADYQQARELGKALADRGFAVCTGGYAGVIKAVSRGAKEIAGKAYGVTAEFFQRQANEWVDVEVRKHARPERLFTLIEMGHGFVACKGGTGTLAELAVVWEMPDKSVMQGQPSIALGSFWRPILERVREGNSVRRSRTDRGCGAKRMEECCRVLRMSRRRWDS